MIKESVKIFGISVGDIGLILLILVGLGMGGLKII